MNALCSIVPVKCVVTWMQLEQKRLINKDETDRLEKNFAKFPWRK